MQTISRVALWGLLVCIPAGAASAQEQQRSLEAGIGLICNSETQVERYLALHAPDKSPDLAITLVNAEAHDPNACAVAAIAFVRGNEGKHISVPGGVMKITPVMILATQTATGWQRIAPIIQFTAIFQKLDEA